METTAMIGLGFVLLAWLYGLSALLFRRPRGLSRCGICATCYADAISIRRSAQGRRAVLHLRYVMLGLTTAILIAIGWDIFSRSPLSRYPSPPQLPVLEPLRAIATISMPDMVVHSAAFSTDGKRLVAAGRTNSGVRTEWTVWACDLDDPKSAWHFQITNELGSYDCATCSPDMKSSRFGWGDLEHRPGSRLGHRNR